MLVAAGFLLAATPASLLLAGAGFLLGGVPPPTGPDTPFATGLHGCFSPAIRSAGADGAEVVATAGSGTTAAAAGVGVGVGGGSGRAVAAGLSAGTSGEGLRAHMLRRTAKVSSIIILGFENKV